MIEFFSVVNKIFAISVGICSIEIQSSSPPDGALGDLEYVFAIDSKVLLNTIILY